MAGTNSAILFLLLSSIVCYVTANPATNYYTKSALCSKSCDYDMKSKYELFSTYHYDYEATTMIQIDTNKNEMSGVKLKSQILLTPLSNCEFQLKMKNVQLEDRSNNQYVESSRTEQLKELMEKEPIHFTINNKNQVDSVCNSQVDKDIVVNIKKSIIDQLVNEKVKGRRQITSNGLVFIDQKSIKYQTKMSSCFLGDLTYLNWIDKSQVTCNEPNKQNNQYPMATSGCKEIIEIQPMKLQGTNRIKIETETNLKFVLKLRLTEKSKMTQPEIKSTLILNNAANSNSVGSLLEASNILKQLCNNEKHSNIPTLFLQLVNQFKLLDTSDIQYLYDQILSAQFCTANHQYILNSFFNAIIYSQNPATIPIMVDLIQSNAISSEQQIVWFSGLINSNQPISEENLIKIQQLLQSTFNTNNQQIWLGTSSLIRQFCANQQSTCQTSPAVQMLFNKLSEPLNNDCTSKSTNEKSSDMLLAIRAIGNSRYFTEDVVNLLKRCATNTKVTTDIRISALEAIGEAHNCDFDKKEILELLENVTEDSEIRINAYITLMKFYKCYNIPLIRRIENLLLKQTSSSNQINSFIMSHLTNLVKKSYDNNNRIQLDVRPIEELLKQVNKKQAHFNIDNLKYSKNIEKTFSLPNMGKLNLDSNIIYSDKSFIPKSISLKSQINILEDTSRDLIEIKTRMDGVEEILFKLLGPDGYMKKSSLNNINYNELLDKLNGNIDLKLFGESIKFLQLPNDLINSNLLQNLLNLNQLKPLNINQQMMLLDKTISISTLIGLPIKFKLQSVAAINSKIDLKVDFLSLLTSKTSASNSNLIINSNIEPKIATELRTEILLITPVNHYGYNYNIQTNSDFKLNFHLKFNKQNGVEIKLDIPQNRKQQLIKLSGNANLILDYKQIPLEINNKNQIKNSICTNQNLIQMIGLKFCTNYQITKLNFNSNFLRNFYFNINLENIDAPNGYVFKLINDNNKLYQLLFDTPNSIIYNRKFLTEFLLDNKENLIQFQFVNPWNELKMSSQLKLEDNEKKINFQISLNKKQIINLKLEHVKQNKKNSLAIIGGVNIEMLNYEPIKLKYSLLSNEIKHTIKVSSKGLFKEKNNLEMSIKTKEDRRLSTFNKYTINGKYNTIFGNGQINGMASESFVGFRWDLELKHFNKNNKEPFKLIFRHKTENKSTKSLMKYYLTTSLKLVNNDKREYFIETRNENEFSRQHLRTLLLTKLGVRGEWKKELKTSLYGGYRWRGNVMKTEGSFKLKCDDKKHNYETRYNCEIGKKTIKMNLKLDRASKSIISIVTKYRKSQNYLSDNDFMLKIESSNKNVKLLWKLKQIDVTKYRYELKMIYNNQKMTINGINDYETLIKQQANIKIKLPKEWINNYDWLQIVQLKYDIKLDEISQSKLMLKLLLPKLKDYKIGIDSKFSLSPQNFQKLSQSASANEIIDSKLIIDFANKQIGNEFKLIFNKKQIRLFLKSMWNKKEDGRILFDVHFQQNQLSTPTQRIDNLGKIQFKYPGNSHKIIIQSEFSTNNFHSNVELIWNRNQRISIITMYELDNGWTQKGLTGQLTIKTPFDNFKLTHIALNAIGQLRYRKIDLIMKYGVNKKINFDIIIQPRTSNDFIVTSKLITPYNGFNLIQFAIKHMLNEKSISSEASVSIGSNRKYLIQLEAINNNDITEHGLSAALKLLTGDLDEPIRITLKHKRSNFYNFESELKCDWLKNEFVKLTNEISFNNANNEYLFNLNSQLISSIESLKQIKLTNELELRNGAYLSNIDLNYKNTNIFKSLISGYYDIVGQESTNLKGDIKGQIRFLNYDTINIISDINYDVLKPSLKTNLELKQSDNLLLYRHKMNFVKLNEKSMENNIIIEWGNNENYQKIEYMKKIDKIDDGDRNDGGNLMKSINLLKINDKYLFKLNSIIKLQNNEGRNVRIVDERKFYSDYYQLISIKTQSLLDYKPNRIELKINIIDSIKQNNIIDLITIVTTTNEFDINMNNIKIDLKLKTKFQPIKTLDFIMKLSDLSINKQRIKMKFDGKLNDDIKLYGEFNWFKIQGRNLKLNIFYEKNKNDKYFIDLLHENQKLGFVQRFNTNLFNNKKSINYICSSEIRGAINMHCQIKSNLFIDIDEEIEEEKQHHQIDLLIKKSRNDCDINFIVKYNNKDKPMKMRLRNKTNYLLIQLNINKIIDSRFEIDLQQINNEKLIIKYNDILQIDYINKNDKNSLKLNQLLKINYLNKEIKINYIFEKVSMKYLLTKLEINQNLYVSLNKLNCQFEYNLKPHNNKIEMIGSLNNHYLKLIGQWRRDKSKVIEFKIFTSFDKLKQIGFGLKHKWNMANLELNEKLELFYESDNDKILLNCLFNIVSWSYLNVAANIEFNVPSLINYNIKTNIIEYKHEINENKIKLLSKLTLSNQNLITIDFVIPTKLIKNNFNSKLILKSQKYSFDHQFDINGNLNDNKQNFDINLKSHDIDLFEFNFNTNFKQNNKYIIENKINIYKLFKQQITAQGQIEKSQLTTKIVIENSLVEIAPIKIKLLSIDPMKSFDLSIHYDNKVMTSLKWNINENIDLIFDIMDSISFKLDFLLMKNKKLNLQLKYFDNLIKTEFIKTNEQSILYLKLNENFLELKLKSNYNLNIDLKYKEIKLELESIINLNNNNINLIINGKSNIENWKTFENKLIINNGIISTFKQNNQIIYQLTLDYKSLYQLIKVDFKSKFDWLKIIQLKVDLGNLLNNANLYFNYNDKTQLRVELKQNKLFGKLTSPKYNWELNGQLEMTKNQKIGSIKINNELWSKPISGKINIEQNDLKSKIIMSFDNLELYKSIEINLLEIQNKQELNILINNKEIVKINMLLNELIKEMDFKLNLPKSIIELNIENYLKIDSNKNEKSLLFKTKSNKWNKIELLINLNLKENEFNFDIKSVNIKTNWKLKSINNQLELNTQLFDKKQKILLIYNIKNSNNLKIELIGENYIDFSILYQHSKIETKFNQLFNINYKQKSIINYQYNILYKLNENLLITKVEINYFNNKNLIDFSIKKNKINFLIKSDQYLNNDIEFELNYQNQYNWLLKIETPIELMKIIELEMKTIIKNNKQNINQIIKLNSNYYGNYELLNIMNEDDEIKTIESILNTPIYKNLFKLNFVDNKQNNKIDTKIDLEFYNEKLINILFYYDTQLLKIVTNTPWNYLNNFNLLIDNKLSDINIKLNYNNYVSEINVKINKNSYYTSLKTNIDYIKHSSLYLSMINDKISFKIEYLQKYILLNMKLNKKLNDYNINFENTLLNKITPELKFNLNNEEIKLINNQQIIFHAYYKNEYIYLIAPNILLTLKNKENLELIVINKDVFKLNIDTQSINNIMINLKYYSNVYTMKTSIQNDQNRFLWILTTKNFDQNLIDLKFGFMKDLQTFDSSLLFENRPIIRVNYELTNEKLGGQKLKSEFVLLEIGSIIDLFYDFNNKMDNIKLNWNFIKNTESVNVGSILLSRAKQFEPINYLLLINFQKSSYMIQYVINDRNQIKFKLSTPFSGIDFDISASHKLHQDGGNLEIILQNTLIGQYNTKIDLKSTSPNRYIKFILSNQNSRLISLVTKLNDIKSSNEIQLKMQLILFDLQPIDWSMKLKKMSTSTNHIEMSLITPYESMKRVNFVKIIRYDSLIDHEINGEFKFEGFTKIILTAKHKFIFQKRILQFNTKLHHKNLELISLTVDHNGNNKDRELKHLVMWKLRDMKYGWKFNGKMNGLNMEGKTEIYHPKSGKIVLIAQRNEDGLLIESKQGVDELNLFKMTANKNEDNEYKLSVSTNQMKRIDLQLATNKMKRRVKRSVLENDGDYENELINNINLKYDDADLINIKSKINRKSNNQYYADLSLKIPMISDRNIKLKINHDQSDQTMIQFDHTIDLDQNEIYRLFGNLACVNWNNCESKVNIKTPIYGNMHASLSQKRNVDNNKHTSHLILKQNDDDIINYNGQIEFDNEQNIYNGQWTLQTKVHKVKVNSQYESTKNKKIETNLFYNDQLLLSIKSEQINNNKLKCSLIIAKYLNLNILTNYKLKILDINLNKYNLILSNNNDNKSAFIKYKYNKKLIGLLEIDYNLNKPIRIFGKLNDKFILVSLSQPIKNEQFELKIETSSNLINKNSKLKINYLILNVNLKSKIEQSLTLKLFIERHQYELSLMRRSNVVSVYLNKHYITCVYKFDNKNEIKFDMKNNFLNIKSIHFKLTNQNQLKLKIDQLEMNLKYNFNNNKQNYNIEITNNLYYPKSIIINSEYKKDNLNIKRWLNNIKLENNLIQLIFIVNQSDIYGLKLEINNESNLDLLIDTKNRRIDINLKINKNVIKFMNKIKFENKSNLHQIFIMDTILEIDIGNRKKSINNLLKLILTNNETILKNQLKLNKENYDFKLIFNPTNKLSFDLMLPWYNMKIEIKINNNNFKINFINNHIAFNSIIEINKNKLYFKLLNKISNKEIIIIDFNKIDKVYYKKYFNKSYYNFIIYFNENLFNFNITIKNEMLKLNLIKPYKISLELINKVDNGIPTWQYKLITDDNIVSALRVWYMRNEYVKIELENSRHIINYYYDNQPYEEKYMIGLNLINTKTNNKWTLKYDKMNKNQHKITYLPGNNVEKTIQYKLTESEIELNILNILHINGIKSKSGFIKLYNKSIAEFKMSSKNQFEIIFNPNLNKKHQIYINFNKNQLILQQTSLNIDLLIKYNTKSQSKNTYYQRQLVINYQKQKYDFNFILKQKTNNIIIELNNPIFPLILTCTREQNSKSNLKYQFQLLNNDTQQQISAYINIDIDNKQERGITLRYYYNPQQVQHYIQGHFKYLNKYEFETALYRYTGANNNNMENTYFRVLISAISKNKVNFHYYISRKMGTILDDYLLTINQVVQINFLQLYKTIQLVTNEINQKSQLLLDTLPTNEMLRKNLYDSSKQLKNEMKNLINEIEILFYNNEFYIRTIFKSASYVLSAPIVIIERIYPLIKNYIITFVEQFDELLFNLVNWSLYPWRLFNTFLESYFIRFNNFKQLIIYKIRILITKLTKCFSFCLNNLNNQLINIIKQNIKSIIKYNQYMKINLMSQIKQIVDYSIDLLNIVTRKEPMRRVLQYLLEEKKIVSHIDLLLNYLMKYSEKLNEKIIIMSQNQYLNYLIQDWNYIIDYLKLIQNLIDLISQQIKSEQFVDWLNDNVSKKIDNSINKVTSKIPQMFWPDIIEINNNMISRHFYLLDATVNFQFNVINDLQSIPNLNVITNQIEDMKQTVQSFRRTILNQIKNISEMKLLLNWFWPSFSLSSASSFSLIPKFESYASLTPNNVITFDKQTFGLKEHETCDVLLILESLYNEWELRMSQKSNEKRGRIYKLKLGANLIELSSNDEMLKLNGKLMELPMRLEEGFDLMVMRIGKIVRLKSDKYGMTMSIDVENDLLTVGLIGWYHGKVSGLFGNADNDAFNDKYVLDKTTSSCTIIEKGQLKQQQHLDQGQASTKSCPFIRKMICNFLYRCPLSPMSACFNTVAPGKFLQLCLESKEHFQMILDPAICNSARAYQTQCNKAGSTIPLPLPCKRCTLSSKSSPIKLNEQINIKVKRKVVDIVMILDESHCLNQNRDHLLKWLDELNMSFKQKHINDIRFGLVSTGNTNIPFSHSHTVGHKLFGNKNQLTDVIKSLNIDSNRFINTNYVNSIELASNYPFSPSSSRHILLLTCNKVEQNNFKQLSLLLNKKSITFNYLTQYQFSKNNQYIHSIDSLNYYSSSNRHGNLLSEISNKNNQDGNVLIIPTNDEAYKLSIKTNGVMINMLSWKFEKSLSSSVKQISNRAIPTRISKCTCEEDDELVCRSIKKHTIFPVKKSN